MQPDATPSPCFTMAVKKESGCIVWLSAVCSELGRTPLVYLVWVSALFQTRATKLESLTADNSHSVSRTQDLHHISSSHFDFALLLILVSIALLRRQVHCCVQLYLLHSVLCKGINISRGRVLYIGRNGSGTSGMCVCVCVCVCVWCVCVCLWCVCLHMVARFVQAVKNKYK